MTHDVDTVLGAYVTCALWSSHGDDGEPLDDWATVADIAPETLAAMRGDVESFLRDCSVTLAMSGLDDHQVGHDLWLTRNGHGAGFWDRGLGAVGDRLTEAAHTYGESDLYVGDDGKVCAS